MAANIKHLCTGALLMHSMSKCSYHGVQSLVNTTVSENSLPLLTPFIDNGNKVRYLPTKMLFTEQTQF